MLIGRETVTVADHGAQFCLLAPHLMAHVPLSVQSRLVAKHTYLCLIHLQGPIMLHVRRLTALTELRLTGADNLAGDVPEGDAGILHAA